MSSVSQTAKGRVHNALKRGQGVTTPLGLIFSRPEACQICGFKPPVARCHMGGKQSNIQAHHYQGYGTLEKDLSVVFVCRPCHAVLHGKERRQHGAA